MTEQQSFKRRIRARMDKTGESYTAARRQLLDKRAAPEPPAGNRVSDEAVRRETGRGWDEWFALLDGWGAADRKHGEIARWLVAEHGVGGWWAQSVTVAYEQARGLRVPGQQSDGLFAAGVTRTVAVPVGRLFEAFADEELRERWLPGDRLEVTTAHPDRSLRARWEDSPTRIAVEFTGKGEAKSVAALSHHRLPDPETGERMKAYWRERMDALKALLES
jgi:uncharacterized protein YndB with AHSA1/START domain